MGWGTIGGEGGGNTRANVYVQMEEGKPKRLHALLEPKEEPRSYWTHYLNNVKQSVICPGKSVCPACKAGIAARMQHAMNVWDYTEKQVKVLEKGNQVYEQIKLFYEMGGNSLDKIDIVIKQTGKGKETKYVTASVPVTSPPGDGPKLSLEDMCAKTDPKKIAELLGSGEFNPEELEDPKAEEPQAGVTSISEVTMPTGKYKGKTLSEIVKIDRNYVQWVQENFTDEEITDAATEALGQTDRTVVPVPAKPAVKVENKKVAEAKALIQQFTEAGGELKAVAQIMKDTAKKTLLKEFTEEELDKFIEALKDTIESLEFAP